MIKLNTKFDADSLLYSLSHFECDSHTVHMLPQCHLQSPLTSTMKLSLLNSPGPPGCINVTETILVILTMVGLFLNRSHIQRDLFSGIFSRDCGGLRNPKSDEIGQQAEIQGRVTI